MRTRFGLFIQLAGLTSSLLLGCVGTADPDAHGDDDLSDESEGLAFQNGVYELQAGHSGKCMAVAGASASAGAKVVQASCSGALDRLWQLRHLGSDVYEAKAAHSGKCMAVKDGAAANGAEIVQANCDRKDPQRWKATRLADGKFTLVAQHSNKCLDVKAANTADGADVHQWTCGGAPLPHQRFQLRRLASDLYDLSVVQRALSAGAGLWSNPATWGGRVPAENTRVTIPAGKTVVLDTDVSLQSLQIDGTLLCASRDLALGAGYIVVHGRLQCGAEGAPFPRRLTVTLTGNNPAEDVMGMGTKFLGAMGAGVIELHGAPRTSWVKLDATANAGATTITLDRRVNWARGNKIVIASTDFDMNQAEERTITDVRDRTITLDRPLTYMHWGQTHEYSNGRKSYTLDERAEVGLLSRNIVIQGDAGSSASGFGGHVMSMRGATLKVSNVEATAMGQRGRMGRYPLHWHMAGDVRGQYIKNSSIHHTFNRCITVHGSSNALVQSNLCYDNVGHAIFLEDGVERGNVIERNLGLVTRRPSAADALLPSDRQSRGSDAMGPSTFWISNPDNILRDNVAAGSDGSGFWYGVSSAPTGLSSGVRMNPSTMPLTEFDGNVTHSDAGFSIVLGGSGDTRGANYNPTETAVLSNSTYYKTRARGAWAHGTNMSFERFVMADNVRGAFFSFTTSLRDSLIVGESPNVGTPVSPLERSLGRSLADPEDGTVAGYVLYDGPVQFSDIHFAGFGRNANNVFIFSNNGAALQTVHNRFERISFAGDTRKIYPDEASLSARNGQVHGALIDVDGSISRRAGSYLLPNLPMNTNENCVQGPWTSRAWVSCMNRYGVVRYKADFGEGFGKGLENVEVSRSDGPRITLNDVNKHWYQLGVIANDDYRYRLAFPAGRFPRVSQISVPGLSATDTVILELSPVPAAAVAKRGGTTLGSARSLNDLAAGAEGRVFRDGSSLYLKVSGRGEVEVR